MKEMYYITETLSPRRWLQEVVGIMMLIEANYSSQLIVLRRILLPFFSRSINTVLYRIIPYQRHNSVIVIKARQLTRNFQTRLQI